MCPEKIQVGARIPKTLFDICTERYDSITTAIIAGLELLVQQDDNVCQTDDNERTTDDNDRITDDNVLQVHALTIRLEEKEALIDVLKEELNDIKATHNNYMLQVQSLINQKAIDAPGEKKKWWEFWK